VDQKSISILGCGWLGEPLARHLGSLGYKVKGSTTHPEKTFTLKQNGIEPFLLEVAPPLKGKQIKEFFQSETLFLNIPFKRSLPDPSLYQKQIEAVIKETRSSPVSSVIFASSTSVYPDNIGAAQEDAVLRSHDLRSKVLLDIERSLLSEKKFRSTILRFAGLVGGDRKIGQFLAEDKDVENPEGPVNLVHLEDCVRVVSRVIEQGIGGEIFNVCADTHPTRREIYTKASMKLGLAPPQFKEMEARVKIVSNEKLKQRLNYKFLYPDPMALI